MLTEMVDDCPAGFELLTPIALPDAFTLVSWKPKEPPFCGGDAGARPLREGEMVELAA